MCVRVYKRESYGVIAKVHSVNNQLPEFDNATPKSFSVDVSMTIMITIVTIYHWKLHRHHPWRPSALDFRRFCLLNHVLKFCLSDIFVCTHCL